MIRNLTGIHNWKLRLFSTAKNHSTRSPPLHSKPWQSPPRFSSDPFAPEYSDSRTLVQALTGFSRSRANPRFFEGAANRILSEEKLLKDLNFIGINKTLGAFITMKVKDLDGLFKRVAKRFISEPRLLASGNAQSVSGLLYNFAKYGYKDRELFDTVSSRDYGVFEECKGWA